MGLLELSQELIPVKDAAQVLHQTPKTIYNWMSMGKIKRVKLGGKSFCLRSQVEQILRDAIGTPVLSEVGQ